ncbi:MAG TPA: S9 family peptidase [Saprospiraceae bacterium]|nr:S9 family peptidase [Saprospiraceae bacterium]
MPVFPKAKTPYATKHNQVLTCHGDDRIDPYYWMNDRSNPKVIEYLNLENSYTDSMLKPYETLRKQIYDEIISRIPQNDDSVPYLKNDFYYQHRFVEGKEYPIYLRKKEIDSSEESILLDVNELAKGHNYYQIGSISVSPDNKIMAYSFDSMSRRLFDLCFKSLESSENYPEIIHNTAGYAVFAKDNKTIFYVVKDPITLRDYKVMKHILGSDPQIDTCIYEEKDPSYYASIGSSKSEEYLLILSNSTLTTEYRYLSMHLPHEIPAVFRSRERGHEYYIDHHPDGWVIRSNKKAPNFKLLTCNTNDTQLKNWVEIVGHNKDVLIEDFELFEHYIAMQYRQKGLQQIWLKPWNESAFMVPFDEEVYSCSLGVNAEIKSSFVRINFQSLKTPVSVIDFNFKDGQFTIRKQQHICGSFQSEDFTTERIYATAHDGTKIPISLVYKNSTPVKANRPLLLYGYGSYGISIEPTFSIPRLSLLDRGFVFAIAHVRGGEEMGKKWYEGGRLLFKKNSFLDFISCAETLVAKGYADPARLCAYGGSAGGLLMGAVVNMRPDLWKAVIAAVPFVDVLTTMLDDSIPLTTGEYDEWGNPNDPVFYEYIKSYSPYDQVKPQDYPSLLITTGLHDSQVQYWEPAKWVARLRELKTNDNPLLLHCNMDTGHGGASGRFAVHKETAMNYTFLLAAIGHEDSK